MFRHWYLLVAAAAIVTFAAVPADAALPLLHKPFIVRQAYNVPVDRPPVKFAGYGGVLASDTAALPGFFVIDPGPRSWSNYVTAARAGVSWSRGHTPRGSGAQEETDEL